MTTTETVRGLESLREEIDDLDRSLVALIATRADLVREARVLEGGEVHDDPARDAAVVRQAAGAARRCGLDPEVIRHVFWRLLSLSERARSADVEAGAG